MQASGDPSGVNISKYASQRSILSADKDINPDAINQLFVKAGKPVRAYIISIPQSISLLPQESSDMRCGAVMFVRRNDRQYNGNDPVYQL
jgi:hypothetical protein